MGNLVFDVLFFLIYFALSLSSPVEPYRDGCFGIQLDHRILGMKHHHLLQ